TDLPPDLVVRGPFWLGAAWAMGVSRVGEFPMVASELADPAEAVLNAERLELITQHFGSYLGVLKLPCFAVLVARGVSVALLSFQGATAVGGATPLGEDTIYRIYSMTKPVTSVAAMMLFEEGKLRLDHELHRYIPEFQDTMVFAGGTAEAPKL